LILKGNIVKEIVIDKDKLEKLYKELKSIKKVAEIFNVSKTCIEKNLHKHEIEIFSQKINLNTTKEELEKLYLELKSIPAIAKIFNVSSTVINKHFKKFNIKTNPNGTYRKYKYNHSFFKEINEHSLYWAGFIAADGCVKEQKNHSNLGKTNYSKILNITLSSKDHEHLEKFAKAINYTGNISKNTYLDREKLRSCSEISLCSQEMFEDLARFNIIPRKTLVLKFPEWLIEHPLVHHFIRGYNDGDGSFYLMKCPPGRTVQQVAINICGTANFLTVCRSIFEEKCNIKIRNTPIPIRKNIGVLEYGGNGVIKSISKFLYKDATVYLERKHDIIKHLL
jgi:transposase